MERRAAVRRAAAMRRRLQRLSSWAGRLVRRRGLALAGLTAIVLLLVDGYNWGFVAPHVTFHKYRGCWVRQWSHGDWRHVVRRKRLLPRLALPPPEAWAPPPVRVLSLRSAHARRHQVEKSLFAAGVDYVTVDAVDGDALVEADREDAHAYLAGERLSKYLSNSTNARYKLACDLSHLRLHHKLLAGTGSWQIILEDDAALANRYLPSNVSASYPQQGGSAAEGAAATGRDATEGAGARGALGSDGEKKGGEKATMADASASGGGDDARLEAASAESGTERSAATTQPRVGGFPPPGVRSKHGTRLVSVTGTASSSSSVEKAAGARASGEASALSLGDPLGASQLEAGLADGDRGAAWAEDHLQLADLKDAQLDGDEGDVAGRRLRQEQARGSARRALAFRAANLHLPTGTDAAEAGMDTGDAGPGTVATGEDMLSNSNPKAATLDALPHTNERPYEAVNPHVLLRDEPAETVEAAHLRGATDRAAGTSGAAEAESKTLGSAGAGDAASGGVGTATTGAVETSPGDAAETSSRSVASQMPRHPTPSQLSPFLLNVHARLSACPEDVDVLMLWMCDAIVQGAVGTNVAAVSRGFCTLGGVYSRRASHYIVQTARKGMRNIDNIILDAWVTGALNVYLADPPMLVPSGDPSLIDRGFKPGEKPDPF